MRESRLSPVVIGGLLAVLFVAGVAGYVTWVSRTQNAGTPNSAATDVLVAIVLPDLEGVVAPRAISLYATSGGRVASITVDPGMGATVPGATSHTLSDAYLYGGGDLLASTYARVTKSATPEWIVIDGATLSRLTGGRDVQVTLSVPVEVFDGTTLSSFATGTVAVSYEELPKLMDGVAFLAPADRAYVRGRLSEAALVGLSGSSTPLSAGVRTNMRPARLAQWLAGLAPTATP